MNPELVTALSGQLDASKVKTRLIAGNSLSYLGWNDVVESLNEVCDYDWQYVITNFQFIKDLGNLGAFHYEVAITIDGVTHSGSHTSLITGSNITDSAVGMANGDAEHTALKRAAAKFGNIFGLGLYKKEDVPNNSTHVPVKSNNNPVPASSFENAGISCIQCTKPFASWPMPKYGASDKKGRAGQSYSLEDYNYWSKKDTGFENVCPTCKKVAKDTGTPIMPASNKVQANAPDPDDMPF